MSALFLLMFSICLLQVLSMELYRNLALAAVCVFVVTLILIANIRTSVLVFICVAFTVVSTWSGMTNFVLAK